MRIDVLLGEAVPTAAEVAGKVVVVVDVLRATTTMASALRAGARAVVPCADGADAVTRARAYDKAEVRLAGERRNVRIEGFDAGNSPRDMTPELVQGRVVFMTTTNGTRALLGTHGAKAVFAGAFVNLTATIDAVREIAFADAHAEVDVLVLCAGQENRMALEDTVCAGAIVRGLSRVRRGAILGDGALVAARLDRHYASAYDRIARDATHARNLADTGFADDVPVCLAVDSCPVVVRYADGRCVAAPDSGAVSRVA